MKLRLALLTIVVAVVPLSAWATPPTRYVCPSAGSQVCGGQFSGGFSVRTWILYVPANPAPSSPLPTVIALHGGYMDADAFEDTDVGVRLRQLVEQERFVLAFPNGQRVNVSPIVDPDTTHLHWNDCRSASDHPEGGWEPGDNQANDVDFLGLLIDRLVEKGYAQSDRVYMMGASNGALMTYRAVRQLNPASGTPKIAAAAAIVGLEPTNGICGNGAVHETPMLIMDGTADPVMNANGGSIHPFANQSITRGTTLSLANTVQSWLDIDGCTASPSVQTVDANGSDQTSVDIKTHCTGAKRVQLFQVNGGGHRVPDADGTLDPDASNGYFGVTSQEIEAADQVWAFLSNFQLDQPRSDLATFLEVGKSVTLTGFGITPGSVLKVFVATSTGVVDVIPNGLAASSTSNTQWTGTLPWPWPVSAPNDKLLGNGFASLQLIRTDHSYDASNTVGIPLIGNAALNPKVPSITGIHQQPLAATSWSTAYHAANVETVVPADGSTSVTITGDGFVSPLVNVFTASGNCGPVTPTSSSINSLTMVAGNGCATGAASFQVVNATGSYLQSNAVAARIRQSLTVSSTGISGNTITVNGSGFSGASVVNFFATCGNATYCSPVGQPFNFGGLDGSGAKKIATTVVSSTQLTFTRPNGAAAGNASVTIVDPPYTPWFTANGPTFQLP